jgi:ergothioneine biosynthesis protein EgtB
MLFWGSLDRVTDSIAGRYRRVWGADSYVGTDAEFMPIASTTAVAGDAGAGVPAERFLSSEFERVRAATDRLCADLQPGDFEAQSMADCSPVKWHLAHTTWFFETFVLLAHAPHYRPFHPKFSYLFNSYYNAVGERHARPERGLLSRPVLAEVWEYRRVVTDAVLELMAAMEPHPPGGATSEIQRLVELGCHHEQQHQELIVTDVKHLFSHNPLVPAFCTSSPEPTPGAGALRWVPYEGGIEQVGDDGRAFAFDNERPRHDVLLAPFALASRPATNAEFGEFVRAGGYRRPELWLDEGWRMVQKACWQEPLYWRGEPAARCEFTAAGERSLDPNEPVSHLSYYEADAFARFAGARLPTEHEWEVACRQEAVQGNLAERGRFHPGGAPLGGRLQRCFGDVWEWTSSAYAAFPGYRAASGAIGEYNGKFMCSQFVLRGGSCATPVSHVRPTYRNFFYPSSRWQFSGVRLAREI